MHEPPSAAALDVGRRLFAGECSFVRGVASVEGLPEGNLPEVAFAGRSNVGKSSLINAVTGRVKLARTSNSPGHTQQLNFFSIQEKLHLVDLPGYGYAQAPKPLVEHWVQLVHDYLRGRRQLQRLCLLIDARHGIKDNDRAMMRTLDEWAVIYQIVLTKADKVPPRERPALLESTQSIVRQHAAALDAVLCTSSETGEGIEELRAELAGLLE